MSSPAHVAVSFLLSQTPHLLGYSLANQEIFTIIIAGNIVDLDYIYAKIVHRKQGEFHHGYLTHTPFGVILIWLGWYVILGRYSTPLMNILMFLSLFLHLILDNASYWLYKRGLQRSSPYPQINWLYPIKPFHNSYTTKKPVQVIQSYISNTRFSFYLEILFTSTAFILLALKLV